jgi:hypothetical protein
MKKVESMYRCRIIIRFDITDKISLFKLSFPYEREGLAQDWYRCGLEFSSKPSASDQNF